MRIQQPVKTHEADNSRPSAGKPAVRGASPVLALQRSAGNAAVVQTLRRAGADARQPVTGSTIQRAPATAAGADTATIAEGEVGEVGPDGVITYPSVTSCLVITVQLRDGGKVGGHASLYQVPGGRRSDQILPAIKAAVGSRRVESIDVSGAVGSWNPSYLEKAIEKYTDDAPPEAVYSPRGIAEVVARVLGRQSKKVKVRDVPDGDVIR